MPTRLKILYTHLHQAEGIARRYFITNGFDGALTMLGLMVGFSSLPEVNLSIAITASVGAAVALFMSGLSSAYLSELAERRKELRELEQAMLTDLQQSDYGRASRYLPVLVALVNGLSPLMISLIIISPLWLALHYDISPFPPFSCAIAVALVLIFMLGVFLGRVAKVFWLWSGLRTLLIAGVTIFLVLLLNGQGGLALP